MKSTFIFVLIFILNSVVHAQLKTKRVLIDGKGLPIVFLHGGTFDYTNFENHSKLLKDSFTVIRMLQFNVQYANEGLALPKSYSVKMESEL